MTATKCTRQGCGKEFDEAQNEEGSCMYHSGAPVFHEGLKSWSCCQDINRPVLDFESFMQIPGCTPGTHTAATNLPVPKPVQTSGVNAAGNKPSSSSSTSTPAKAATSSASTPGTEVFTTPTISQSLANIPPPAPTPVVEDEDDVDVQVNPGTKCLRNGCKYVFESDEVSRGEQAQCVYHPKPPVFHEGSKGYLCCKRRVLEFDEFLKIEGCKTGKHVFVKKKRTDETGAPTEELVQCRIDHYQTPGQVLVTIYAKKCSQADSEITFEPTRVHIDLSLPDSKRFKKTLELFGSIVPEKSTYKVYGTKVDMTLVKSDARSWNLLESTNAANLANIGFNLTFGVGGRTGTTGAKEAVLDDENKSK